MQWNKLTSLIYFITPHAQLDRGKVIDHGVHILYIYIILCLWTKKIFESYFRDRLTFSNIRNRTSRRIYRLALPLRSPETLSSLSKSRISIFNAHLTLFVRRMMSHNSIGKYRHLTWNLPWNGASPFADQTKNAELERSECLELHCLLL